MLFTRSSCPPSLQRLAVWPVALLLLLPLLAALPATHPVAAATCAATFGFTSKLLTGSSPSSIVIGDLNSDGRPDMAVASQSAGTVSILLASGSAGSFAPKVDYSVGGSPFFVAEGDLNNDERLDLVVTNGAGSNISVLLATGSPGSFAPKVDYQVGNGPFTVKIGDLNGDGRLDLAVTNQENDTISILLASGSPGTFAPKVDYTAGSKPRSLAIGDLNSDGRLDLAVMNVYSGTVGILLANGAPGSFAPMVTYPATTGSWSIAIGDLNGDGRLDLATVAVINASSARVGVLLASGAPGSFAPPIEYPTGIGPFALAIGDLNGDGRPDLATANYSSNSVSVLMANGSPGSFAPYFDVPVGKQPVSIAIGDLDGDGRSDLAVANNGDDTVSVLLNQAAPTTLSVSTPAGVTTGSPFAVTATLQDACGDVATSFAGPVTLAIKAGSGTPGATLSGTATVNAINGVANFSVLSLDKRGAGYILTATTGSLTGNTMSFAVSNAPPVARDDNFSILEDTSLPPTANVLANDTDADGDTLTPTIVSGPAHGTFVTTYTPAADYNGTDSLSYRAYDGAAFSNLATASLTILPVNDAPIFGKGADQAVNEDAGPQSVHGWATGICPGPATAADETNQALDFVVTNDNNTLFATQPAISPDGTLSYTPAPNANGSATVTVRLHDDGGTANGGSNLSAPQTTTITISPVNDPPDFAAGPDLVIGASAGPQIVPGWASGFTPGPPDEANQALLGYTIVSNSNPALFLILPAVDQFGTLTYTPRPGTAGLATIHVTARDSGGTANQGTDTSAAHAFTITITPVYQNYVPLVLR